MPDSSFDAVIVGGGNKALFLAMYLMKYGDLRVAIFERRHEIGGAGEAYNCFKIIAAESGLDVPWRKLGNEETESLLAEVRKVVARVQGSSH